jgi:dihydroflavonol-4-reductase
MKTAYITGATGCVGRNIIENLNVAEWDIVVLHRKSSDLSRLQGCRVRFQEVDLYDLDSVRHAIAQDTEVFFHVAGNTSHWPSEASQQWNDNVLVTRNLVQIAIEKKVKRFIFTSTGATRPYQHLDEKQCQNIKAGYKRTKRLAEIEVVKGLEQGLDAVIIQPTIVVGAYDYNSYAQIFTGLKSGEIKIVFPGKIAFCHANDVAKAHVQAYEKGRCGEHYVLGGTYTTWLDFFVRIARVVGVKPIKASTSKGVLRILAYLEFFRTLFTRKKPQLTSDLIELVVDDPDLSYFEKNRSQQELGYESASIDQMVSDCYAWMKKEGRI